MKKVKLSILFLGVFLAGCFAATVIQPLVVPPAHAQNTVRYEYHCQDIKAFSFDALNTDLNRFGAAGWDLVNFVGNKNCFKRPL